MVGLRSMAALLARTVATALALTCAVLLEATVIVNPFGRSVGFQQEGTLVFQNLSPLTCPPAPERA
jgi:hypothetical protein